MSTPWTGNAATLRFAELIVCLDAMRLTEHAAADVHPDPLVTLLCQDLAAEPASCADIQQETWSWCLLVHCGCRAARKGERNELKDERWPSGEG